MRIAKVRLSNFRTARDCEVDCDPMTAFLGANGVGKSTLLYALDAFYDPSRQFTKHDYFGHQTDGVAIRIEVTFTDLRPDELEEFGTYVHNGRLVVSKIITTGGAVYVGSTRQIPQFADLRRSPPAEKRRGLVALIQNGTFPDFGDVPRSGDEVEVAMQRYEAAHDELLQLVDRQTQFFGPANVGGGKLDKFTKFVLVPAVRDITSEMERRGAVMQLIDLLVARSINSRPDFQQFIQQFQDRARELYGHGNVPELDELAALITQRLARYSPGAALAISFEDVKPPTIPLPQTSLTVSDDNFPVPLTYTGHGLQRALIVSLLEQLSLTEAHPAERPDGENEAEAPPIPDLILAIEEPELYLHPGRSRYLFKILSEMSARKTGTASSTQVLYVTHSPYFIDIDHFDQVRMCRKVRRAGEELPRETAISAFSRTSAAATLATLTGRRAEDFTAASFAARAAPILTSVVSEGFFAQVAVVVEGESDVSALWQIQKLLNLRWDELGVALLPVDGKNNIASVAITFRGFEIPTFFVFDGDLPRNSNPATNRLLLRLAEQGVVDFPATSVGHIHAVFEDRIESTIAHDLGADYARLRHVICQARSYGDSDEALKNSHVMADLIRQAYSEGLSIPTLERVARAITALAQ